jgi:reductive dehalogenase
MTTVVFLTGAALLIGQALFALTFFVASIREKENLAPILAGFQLLVMVGIAAVYIYLATVGFYESRPGFWMLLILLVYGYLLYSTLIRRWGVNKRSEEGTQGFIVEAVERFDERETVFARDRLQPDTDEYKVFYGDHPEYEARDTDRRKMGGIFGKTETRDNPHERSNSAALMAQSLFPYLLSTPDRLKPRGFVTPEGERPVHDPEEATTRIKGYARSIGADIVGVTKVNPLWVYSHRGMDSRGDEEEWGRQIALTHEYAVVFATEMAFEMVRTAPRSASTVETMRNYAQGAIISTMLASYIANLGYSATAQHVGHYDVLLVPMAVDAGLGELGRHGYLMTKELGPRLRLAAVTTDMPLIPDKPVDIGVQDFCDVCQKCATCCPSKSIPMGDAEPYNGTLRWKLNADTCHDYWGKVGSDCNICMRVCPWSHPNTFPHRMITESVSRNKVSRRLFTLMDDVFYGKKPGTGDPPRWASFRPWDIQD